MVFFYSTACRQIPSNVTNRAFIFTYYCWVKEKKLKYAFTSCKKCYFFTHYHPFALIMFPTKYITCLFFPGFLQVMHLMELRSKPLESTSHPAFVISLFALTSSIMCWVLWSCSGRSSRSAGLKMFLDWGTGKYKPPRLEFIHADSLVYGSRLKWIQMFSLPKRTKSKNVTGGYLVRLFRQKINLIIKTNSSQRTAVGGAFTRLPNIVGEKTETNELMIYAVANPQSIQTKVVIKNVRNNKLKFSLLIKGFYLPV